MGEKGGGDSQKKLHRMTGLVDRRPGLLIYLLA